MMNKKRLIEELILHFEGEESDSARRQVLMYRHLPQRSFEKEDVIVPSALIQVRWEGRHQWVFLVPGGGGQILNLDGIPVQVVTPQSPLGDALLGKRQGDRFELQASTQMRLYEILEVK
jgi:hypothetical protein